MAAKQPSRWARILIPAVLIVAWLVGAAIGGPYFGKISEVSTFDLTAFLPESAEATKVNDKLKQYISDKTLSAVVVFEATDGKVNDKDQAAIDSAASSLEDMEGVKGSVSPAIVSDDKKAAFVSVPINTDSEIDAVVDDIRQHIKDEGVDNTKVYVTGPAGFSADLNVAFSGIDGILLIVALSVVFVILLVVYRSPLLPIIVLMTALFALTVSVLIVWGLANADIVTLNGQTQGILFILVIGAATDYSLLYVSRYREELHRHEHNYQAALAAWKAAVEPILASGGTVIAGLLCLLISDLASNKALGPVGSIGIVMAMVSALTFLPSVLVLLGRTSYWPFRPKYDGKHAGKALLKYHKGLWPKVGKFVGAYPRRIWIVATLVLLVAISGIFHLKADGVSQSDLIIGYSEAREGQSVLNDHFPKGSGSPVLALVPASQKAEVVKAFDEDKSVDSISVVTTKSDPGFKPVGEYEASIKQDIREGVEAKLAEQRREIDQAAASYGSLYDPAAEAAYKQQAYSRIPSVESLVEQAYPFSGAKEKMVNDQVLLQITLSDAPDSDAAKDAVLRLRDEGHAVSDQVLVGGTTAAQLDSNITSIHDRAIIIPMVLGVITLILMVLLRAVIAPILLLLSTVLSFGTTLGVASYLFNDLLHLPGMDPSVVLYGFIFLVALGIDYNIFLMTRVREESKKFGTHKGVITGLIVTGGVITSAGIVLAATFAALSVIPILFLLQLAFIVAFGVLLDTIVVRSLLVPALIRDIGSFVWWPSRLRHKK